MRDVSSLDESSTVCKVLTAGPAGALLARSSHNIDTLGAMGKLVIVGQCTAACDWGSTVLAGMSLSGRVESLSEGSSSSRMHHTDSCSRAMSKHFLGCGFMWDRNCWA